MSRPIGVFFHSLAHVWGFQHHTRRTEVVMIHLHPPCRVRCGRRGSCPLCNIGFVFQTEFSASFGSGLSALWKQQHAGSRLLDRLHLVNKRLVILCISSEASTIRSQQGKLCCMLQPLSPCLQCLPLHHWQFNKRDDTNRAPASLAMPNFSSALFLM